MLLLKDVDCDSDFITGSKIGIIFPYNTQFVVLYRSTE